MNHLPSVLVVIVSLVTRVVLSLVTRVVLSLVTRVVINVTTDSEDVARRTNVKLVFFTDSDVSSMYERL